MYLLKPEQQADTQTQCLLITTPTKQPRPLRRGALSNITCPGVFLHSLAPAFARRFPAARPVGSWQNNGVRSPVSEIYAINSIAHAAILLAVARLGWWNYQRQELRKVMREPPIIVALALMLVAPSFSALGRGGARFEEGTPLRAPDEETIRAPDEETIRAPEEQTIRAPEEQTIRAPEEQTIRAPEEQTLVPTRTFGDRVYHGQLAWGDGRWRYREGREGWWWDVGGFWYFYPQQTEGPPDYISDVEVADTQQTSDGLVGRAPLRRNCTY
jgi:hypothetical protein